MTDVGDEDDGNADVVLLVASKEWGTCDAFEYLWRLLAR